MKMKMLLLAGALTLAASAAHADIEEDLGDINSSIAEAYARQGSTVMGFGLKATTSWDAEGYIEYLLPNRVSVKAFCQTLASGRYVWQCGNPAR
jgi:hypothetical protein